MLNIRFPKGFTGLVIEEDLNLTLLYINIMNNSCLLVVIPFLPFLFKMFKHIAISKNMRMETSRKIDVFLMAMMNSRLNGA